MNGLFLSHISDVYCACNLRSRMVAPVIALFALLSSYSALSEVGGAPSITYATRIDAVSWSFEGSKFSCQLTHDIHDFGRATFERQAGLPTEFSLHSQSPRMKSGKADLLSQPPMWLVSESAQKIAEVDVSHGEVPVKLARRVSERMLAELQKGMDLQVIRQPWYGDPQSLKVVIPSVAFRKTYGDYLSCLGRLLPVNFSQVEKKSLYYSNDEEGLSAKTKSYLEKVAMYVKEDFNVKVIYVDGHTDSVGVRNDNLLKSKERAERLTEYLVELGVPSETIVTRWHGERYQVTTNQTKSGRSKNRRVTLRLSKSERLSEAVPQTLQSEANKTANEEG